MPRHPDERLALRFPALYHRLLRRAMALPVGSRLRKRFLKWATSRMFEAFSRGDAETFLLPFDPGAEWMAARQDPDAATHRGSEAIGRYFAQWTGMFESIDLRAEELIDAGDKVFTWIRISGKGVASGAPVEMEQAQIWTFREGKVVRVEEYFDRTEALEAAGLSSG